MATTRIKDLTNTATTVASDEYLAVDGTTNGTSKITRDNFRSDTAAAFVAAPGTYNLAPLSGGAVLIDKGGTAATTAAGARTNLDVPSNAEAVLVANNLSDVTAATARTNLSVNSIDEDAEATGTKLVGPALYFDGSNDFLEVSDSSKLTFSSSAEFGTNSSGMWSPDDNSPALTDGTGTLNQHYRVDSGAGTVTQGASTLSIINGTATTAGQAVYYDGSVWRLKDVDDLPFSISAWVKMEDATNFTIIAKNGGSDSVREWMLWVNNSDKLQLWLRSTDGSYWIIPSNDALNVYEGQFIHVVATYGGSGPNSDSAFSAADSEVTLYINGVSVTKGTATQNGAYIGMSDTAQAVRIGNTTTAFAKGHIKDVKIFNRSLTADEVAQLARGNDLGFSSEWGGALGGVYTSDFTSDSTDSWTANDALISGIATVGGEADNIQLTVNSATSSDVYLTQVFSGMPTGKRIRFAIEYYLPSTNSDVDGIQIRNGGAGGALIGDIPTATQDAWTTASFEMVPTQTTVRIYATEGGSRSVTDAGTDDTFAIRRISITEIGTLADFRAENFDSDTGKIYDISDNAFVGTSANLPTLTGRAYPVYETGTWTPSLYFSGTSAATYSAQSGYYTRIGNTVYVRGSISVSGVGASSGSVSVAGLPFQPSSDGASSSIAGCHMTSAANLTSQPIGLVYDGVSLIDLYDAGATGNTALDETNITASSVIKVSATYQIQ